MPSTSSSPTFCCSDFIPRKSVHLQTRASLTLVGSDHHPLHKSLLSRGRSLLFPRGVATNNNNKSMVNMWGGGNINEMIGVIPIRRQDSTISRPSESIPVSFVASFLPSTLYEARMDWTGHGPGPGDPLTQDINCGVLLLLYLAAFCILS